MSGSPNTPLPGRSAPGGQQGLDWIVTASCIHAVWDNSSNRGHSGDLPPALLQTASSPPKVDHGHLLQHSWSLRHERKVANSARYLNPGTDPFRFQYKRHQTGTDLATTHLSQHQTGSHSAQNLRHQHHGSLARMKMVQIWHRFGSDAILLTPNLSDLCSNTVKTRLTGTDLGRMHSD
jgi:hypothetical protein